METAGRVNTRDSEENMTSGTRLMLSVNIDIPEFRHRADALLNTFHRTTKESGKNLHPVLALRPYLDDRVSSAYDALVADTGRRQHFRIYTARDVVEYDEDGNLLYLPAEPDGVEELFVDDEGVCNMASEIAAGRVFPSANQYRAYMETEGITSASKASLSRAMRRAQANAYFGVIEHLIEETIPLPDANKALAELDCLEYDEGKFNLVTFAGKVVSLQRRAYGEALSITEDNVSAVTRVIQVLRERVHDFDNLDNGGEHAVSITDASSIQSLRCLFDRLRYHSERRANRKHREMAYLQRAELHTGQPLSAQQRRIFLQNANARGYDRALKRLSTALRSPRKAKHLKDERGRAMGPSFEEHVDGINVIEGKKWLPYKSEQELESLGIPLAIYLRARNAEAVQRTETVKALPRGRRLPLVSDAELQRRFRSRYRPAGACLERRKENEGQSEKEQSGLFSIYLETMEIEEAFLHHAAAMSTVTNSAQLSLPTATHFHADRKQQRPYVTLAFGKTTERCLVDSGCSLPAVIPKLKINAIYAENPGLVGAYERFPENKHLTLVGVNGSGSAKIIGIVELVHSVRVKNAPDVPYARKYAVIDNAAHSLPLIWGLPTIVEERLCFGQSNGSFYVFSLPDEAEAKGDPTPAIKRKSEPNTRAALTTDVESTRKSAGLLFTADSKQEGQE